MYHKKRELIKGNLYTVEQPVKCGEVTLSPGTFYSVEDVYYSTFGEMRAQLQNEAYPEWGITVTHEIINKLKLKR